MLRFDYLDGALGYWLNDKQPDFAARFCNDSRKVGSGDCFLAIRTELRDGNNFLFSAKENGAVCAFVDFPQPRVDIPQFVCHSGTLSVLEKFAQNVRKHFDASLLAITGSMGKTSTKDLISTLLGVQNNKTILNENNRLGILMTMCRLCRDEDHAVIEIGVDRGGEMDEQLQIVQPTNGLITGVCRIHVGNFGTEELIAQEKSKLAARTKNNLCIFHEDLLRFGCFKVLKDECVVPSKDPFAKVHYSIVEPENILKLVVDGSRYELKIPFNMSSGMVQNLVLAATYAIFSGISSNVLQSRLSTWQPSNMRGQIIKTDKRVFYADCYNANFASFKDSLENFNRLFPRSGRLFIIGCLDEHETGDDCEFENYKLGQMLPLMPNDTVFLVGEHSEAVKRGMLDKKLSFICTCVQNPPNLAGELNKFEGVVYIKGHHFYRFESLINDERFKAQS